MNNQKFGQASHRGRRASVKVKDPLYRLSVQQGAWRRYRLRGFVLSLASLLFLAACTTQASSQLVSANVVDALSGVADEGYARAYEPIDFVFPADHGAHPEYQTEWWYFTGNLTDEQGREHGYQFTVFRSAAAPMGPPRESDLAANQVYMAHLAVTDGAADRHWSFERFSRGAGDLAGAVGEPAFEVWLEDWSVIEAGPGRYVMQALAPTDGGVVELDLTLVETRPPVLHGDAGLSQKGAEPGNASYYYSLVGLETTGTIRTPRTTSAVSGVSWMDHEFGTSALSEDAVGWDWFSVQLNNGAALMFAQIRTADGRQAGDFEGTLLQPDGSQQTLRADDFELTVLGEWTSAVSGVTYPSGWRVVFPNHTMELMIQPLIEDQEMKVGYRYWEGAVTAAGTMSGQPVTGRGYVELTGYGAEGTTEYQR